MTPSNTIDQHQVPNFGYTFQEWLHHNEYWSPEHKKRIKLGFIAWIQQGGRAGKFAEWLKHYNSTWSDKQHD